MTTRADLHCHSSASEEARLGVQRAITDHDTIAGALELAERPDVFVSEELTAWFPGERERIGRWDRGVDVTRFSPARRRRDADGRIDVLYAGRLTRERASDCSRTPSTPLGRSTTGCTS